MPRDDSTRKLFDVHETAEMLGVSANHLRRQAYEGKLPYVKIGASLRFTQEAVDAFIEAHTVRASAIPVPVGRKGRKAAK